MDFVRDHFPDLAVFHDASLRGIGYVPVDDPLRRDHVAEVRHVHLGDIVELNVRKIRNVPALMTAQVAADLAHGLHSLLVDFLAGLNARAANLDPVLGRHFQQRFCHRTAARVLNANE